MNRTAGATLVTTTAATLTAAALAVSTMSTPAHAEAVVYETRDVKAVHPGGGTEWAALDVPTGYERHRLSWRTVRFVEKNGAGRTITLNLAPEHDTVGKLKAERQRLKERAGDSYREFAFVVNPKDTKVRAKWVYTFQAEGTGDTEPFVSIYLMRGNRLRVVGSVSERKQVRFIRDHVVRSVVFPS